MQDAADRESIHVRQTERSQAEEGHGKSMTGERDIGGRSPGAGLQGEHALVSAEIFFFVGCR